MSKETSKELENKIEAILFASGKGVRVIDLSKNCEESEKKILDALKRLQKEYSERDTSLQISTNEDRWKLTVKSKYVVHIEKLVSETELPQPVLKTLAVVAFKSPVLQSEIVDMRGQGAYDHIKQLVGEKFITKDESGRSYVLKITDKFYEYFDVEGDEEIREVFAKLKEQQIQKLGELEVIDIEKEKKNHAKTSGLAEDSEAKEILKGLEVIKIQEDSETKERLLSEKRERRENEKIFLSDMDSQINNLSKKIAENDFVIEPMHKESDEQNNEDSETYENKDVEEKKQKSEDVEDPIETLNKFAESKKRKKEEDFL